MQCQIVSSNKRVAFEEDSSHANCKWLVYQLHPELSVFSDALELLMSPFLEWTQNNECID